MEHHPSVHIIRILAAIPQNYRTEVDDQRIYTHLKEVPVIIELLNGLGGQFAVNEDNRLNKEQLSFLRFITLVDLEDQEVLTAAVGFSWALKSATTPVEEANTKAFVTRNYVMPPCNCGDSTQTKYRLEMSSGNLGYRCGACGVWLYKAQIDEYDRKRHS